MENITKIPFIAAFVFASAAMIAIGGIQANAQTTTTTGTTTGTTTTTPAHFFHGGHFAWRLGHAPYGIFQGNNVVTIPASQLAQNVVNNCPSYAPVLLSTGVCETQQQALTQQQTGQVTVGGQVQALGQVVVGTPTIIAVQHYNNPYTFFGHFRR